MKYITCLRCASFASVLKEQSWMFIKRYGTDDIKILKL